MRRPFWQTRRHDEALVRQISGYFPRRGRAPGRRASGALARM